MLVEQSELAPQRHNTIAFLVLHLSLMVNVPINIAPRPLDVIQELELLLMPLN